MPPGEQLPDPTRDMFAAHALEALLVAEWRQTQWYKRDGFGSTWQLEAAKDAYKLADAMMQVRNGEE